MTSARFDEVDMLQLEYERLVVRANATLSRARAHDQAMSDLRAQILHPMRVLTNVASIDAFRRKREQVTAAPTVTYAERHRRAAMRERFRFCEPCGRTWTEAEGRLCECCGRLGGTE